MVKTYTLSEYDIQLAIAAWLRSAHGVVVEPKRILLTQSQPDRPSDTTSISATATAVEPRE